MKVCGLGCQEAYNAYLTDIGGDIEETTWNAFFSRAAAFLSTETLGKSAVTQPSDITERCLMSLGAVIEGMAEASTTGGGVISESNDGISVTYASSKDTRTSEQRYHASCATYLAGTGLLYRGVGHIC